MATSSVEIVNRALTMLGASPINSLTEDTRNARIMNRIYDSSLRAVLSECLWTFATKRKNLAQLSEDPEWTSHDLNYVYQRPSDCIRIFGWSKTYAVVREESDKILSDEGSLGLLYVFYQDDPTKYSASFVEALADKLASDTAFMVLNSTAKGEAMLKKYEGVSLPKAMAENSQLQTPVTPDDNAWVDAKYSGETIYSKQELRFR